MSDTKLLKDKFKNAQTVASSLSNLWTLFADSSGALQKAVLMKEATGGSSIANGQGAWLIAVYDKTDLTKLHIAIVLRNASRVELHTIYQSNLSLIFNQVGTVALSTTSAAEVQNPVFVAMRLSMGAV